MNITRRSALTLIGALPAGVSLWIGEASAITRSTHARIPLVVNGAAAPDRELSLTLGDGFRRQHWTYASQKYLEMREDIVLYEGEVVRMHILNDTSETRSLSLDDAQIAVGSGQRIAFDLHVEELETKVLRMAHSNTARTLVVRPSYQSHPAIINA